MVKTRSYKQTRSHSQKCFVRLKQKYQIQSFSESLKLNLDEDELKNSGNFIDNSLTELSRRKVNNQAIDTINKWILLNQLKREQKDGDRKSDQGVPLKKYSPLSNINIKGSKTPKKQKIKRCQRQSNFSYEFENKKKCNLKGNLIVRINEAHNEFNISFSSSSDSSLLYSRNNEEVKGIQALGKLKEENKSIEEEFLEFFIKEISTYNGTNEKAYAENENNTDDTNRNEENFSSYSKVLYTIKQQGIEMGYLLYVFLISNMPSIKEFNNVDNIIQNIISLTQNTVRSTTTTSSSRSGMESFFTNQPSFIGSNFNILYSFYLLHQVRENLRSSIQNLENLVNGNLSDYLINYFLTPLRNSVIGRINNNINISSIYSTETINNIDKFTLTLKELRKSFNNKEVNCNSNSSLYYEDCLERKLKEIDFLMGLIKC